MDRTRRGCSGFSRRLNEERIRFGVTAGPSPRDTVTEFWASVWRAAI